MANTEVAKTTNPVNGAENNNIAGFLAVIERVSSDPNVDVTKFETLMNMQERIMAKNAEMAFNQAMARLQPVLPIIRKTTKAHNSTYAKYEDIEYQIRPFYTSEGFSVSYTSKRQGDIITYYGTLSHIEGHSKTAEIDLPADDSGKKNPIQAKASTMTYAKRYLLTMLLNIVTADEDDDGIYGGSQMITEIEVKVLQDMINRVGADKAAFLKYLGAESLESIPARDFRKAENALKAKAAKK